MGIFTIPPYRHRHRRERGRMMENDGMEAKDVGQIRVEEAVDMDRIKKQVVKRVLC